MRRAFHKGYLSYLPLLGAHVPEHCSGNGITFEMKYQCEECGEIIPSDEIDGVRGHCRMVDDGRGNPEAHHCGPVSPVHVADHDSTDKSRCETKEK